MIYDRQEADRAVRWMVLGIAILGLFLFTISLAAARDDGRYADSELHVWFEQQHNARGEWCCNKSDGHPYYGQYTLNPDGSVTLEDGHRIEAYMVLKTPNPVGSAVWWRLGERDYCFAVGPLG